jgi:hypothetical protein
MLEGPETIGTRWHGSVGGGIYSATDVEIVKDTTDVPPQKSGAGFDEKTYLTSFKGSLAVHPQVDLGMTLIPDFAPSFWTAKYNFLGGLGRPGFVGTLMAGFAYENYGQSDDDNGTFGGNDVSAKSLVRIYGMLANAMFGYKWHPQMGAYLTFSHLAYRTNTRIDQTINGTETRYEIKDTGRQDILGLGYFWHKEHLELVGEWTYSNVHWSSIEKNSRHGGIGTYARYIF